MSEKTHTLPSGLYLLLYDKKEGMTFIGPFKSNKWRIECADKYREEYRDNIYFIQIE